MKSELSFKTAICTDYENLLFSCQKALESWRARREEAASQGFASKKTSDELLRLQADYASAYSRLESHEERCSLCRFVSKIGGRNYSSISVAALEKKPSA
jgi:muconolactone delta-isomerase